MSSGASSSGPRSRTIHERKWIDVEPEEYDAHSFGVAKKMNKLLRHELLHLREEDGAVAFKNVAPMFVSQFGFSLHWSIRIWLNHLQSGGAKKKFQYCTDPNNAEAFLTFEPFKVTKEELRSILLCKTWWCYQMTLLSTSTTLDTLPTCTPSQDQV